MATNTYVALDKVTVGSAVSSATLSSISQAYTDLVIVMAGTCNTGLTSMNLTFNSDTTSNYSMTRLYGSGSAAFSERQSNVASMIVGVVSTSQSNNILQIQNYSNATTYKTVLTRQNVPSDTSVAVAAGIGLWRKTPEAITSITLTAPPYNFQSGTTFSLYGISSAGDSSPKAIGGEVYSDANYWYHAFPMSGNFVPNQSLTADILVVAGGGGGGAGANGVGGGGGAGGVRQFLTQSLITTSYTCTIGGGGATDSNGVSSSFAGSGFSTISASGGGAGGSVNQVGSAGGSGGGGATYAGGIGDIFAGGAGNTGSYSPVEGFAGGSSDTNGSNPPRDGGGGGGAGGAGGNGLVSGAGGAGGIGATSTLISEIVSATGVGEIVSSVAYIGGGGGGASSGSDTQGPGGAGGGGRGTYGANTSISSLAGTQNTGGGGGGQISSRGQSQGGSGVVIVRYAK